MLLYLLSQYHIVMIHLDATTRQYHKSPSSGRALALKLPCIRQSGDHSPEVLTVLYLFSSHFILQVSS